VESRDRGVLLERRPARGIWGGLWSFPELGDQEHAEQWCARLLGDVPMAARKAGPIRHGFTHFELILEPMHVALQEDPGLPLDDPNYLWYKPALDRVGVPAPVSAYLESLADEDSS
jgi:A/G-specific adenine glycosylase